jgi:hypothetical protein
MGVKPYLLAGSPHAPALQVKPVKPSLRHHVRRNRPIPPLMAMQQYLLLQRNLVYTGITRGKKLVVVVGQRRALGMAVKNNRTQQRFSGLLARLKAEC